MIPAEVFRLGEYLAEEMQERGWKSGDVAARMTGEYGYNVFALELVLAIDDDELRIDDDLFDGLALVFDVHPEFFRNLHRTWLDHPDRRSEFDPPDDLFSGGSFPPTH